MKLKRIFFVGVTALTVGGGISSCNNDETVLAPANLGSSQNEIYVSASAGIYNLEVYTNYAYHVELAGEAGWVDIAAGDPADNVAIVSIKYAANDRFARMVRFALVSENDETLRDTVSFMQRAGQDPVLRFDDTSFVVVDGSKGGETEIPVVTNIPFEDIKIDIQYDNEDDDEWITSLSIIGDESSEERTLVVGYAGNSNGSSRLARLQFSFTDGWGTDYDFPDMTLLQTDESGELIEERVLFEENWDWLKKFEAWFDSNLNGDTDSVGRGKDIETDRVDSDSFKRTDGVTMLRYMLDTLQYHFYVIDHNNSDTEVLVDRDGYTPLWGNGGTYYMGCSNQRARVFVVVPKFEVPTKNTLYIELSVDVARKGTQADAALRFNFLTEKLESKASRYIDIRNDVSETYTWKNYTFDITDIDFEEAPIFGFGSGVFEYTGNDATFWLDNIKITWVGYK